MSRTSQLFELQQVDTESDERLRRALAINHALGETESLRAARAAREAAAAALGEAQKALRAASHEVETLSEHLATQSKRLYDGTVKNPKELVAIEHDIVQTKQVRSAREDTLLEAMEAVDARQAEFDAADRALALGETEWERSQEGLLEEKDAVDTQLKALRVRREKLIPGIDWADLQLYERLRKAKHGVAVAAMANDICQACRVTIPGGTARSARQGHTFVTCPSCGRLLHPGERGEMVR